MPGFPDNPGGPGRTGNPPPGPVRRGEADAPPGIFASLSVRQPRGGYRFSIDSVLLADFAAARCGERVLDLGTGSGVILLLLAERCGTLREGVGVEIQEELWRAAAANIEENGLSGRLSARRCDFREKIPGLRAGSFDLVVSNPPFRRVGEGRRNPDRGKEIARHEVACTFPDLFAAARRYLAPRGSFAMISPAGRLPEILSLAAGAGIAPDSVRLVHPFADAPANRVLFAGTRGSGQEPLFLPPLVVYSGPGRYHPETEGILSGRSR
ncbi:MAG TPA: methyltransferase domain-containing protein [Candidatus Deferrimicrobiaceae bacterium]